MVPRGAPDGPAAAAPATNRGGSEPAAPDEPSQQARREQSPQQTLREGILAALPQLRGFARFLVRDAAMADDLVQETLLRALAAAAQFQPGTSVRAWIFTIQRNLFYEQIRRRRRERAALEHSFVARPPEAPDVSLADVADLQAMLWRLPPLQREALVLVGAQGLSHAEAAAICQVPVGTMRARVARARAALSSGIPPGGAAARAGPAGEAP